MGSPVPPGMSAVYMRIKTEVKTKWKQLAKQNHTDMTNYFLDWLKTQRVKK